MPQNFNSRPVSEPFTVGNVVSAGLRIYRDNFKTYYLEALKSYLWIFVPVYGWAKFAAIQGVIGRLAFFEVREMPESLVDARRQVMPKLWIFLITGLLSGLIILAGLFIFGVIAALLSVGFAVNIQNNPFIAVVFGLIILFLLIFSIFAYIWLISRISFADMAIAIDEIREPTKAIGRSWKLTQGFVVKIQIIFFVAFLLTIPLSILSNLGTLFVQDSAFASLINLILTIFLGALLVPFWQSIKAVIYYDLLTRKEGLGIELRDSNNDF